MESLAKNMNMNKNMNMESLAKPLVMAKLNICHGKTEMAYGITCQEHEHEQEHEHGITCQAACHGKTEHLSWQN